jgi:hypothetical protein
LVWNASGTLLTKDKIDGASAYRARIADHPAQKLDQLLPWNWNGGSLSKAA